MAAVAKMLDERQRTTKCHRSAGGRLREPRQWTKVEVRRVLLSPLYAGYICYGAELHKGEHQPIVDRDTHSRVRALLEPAERAGPKRRRSNPDYILRGLLRCACCGSAFTPGSTYRGDREYRYYRCVTRDKQGKDACPASPLPAAAIEESTSSATFAPRRWAGAWRKTSRSRCPIWSRSMGLSR